MSRHTSWRVGGPADIFFVPASIADLSAFLAELDDDTPLFWHGVGSNLLVRDGGIRGVVVSATKALRELHRVDDNRVRAGAGLSCTQLARECIRWELGPSEFFAGIPGTVGGALAMNAGAHGGEIRSDEPMSRHTSWRVGGPADIFFVPASIADLSAFLAELDDDTPLFWHGVGSNLLVRDGGIRGVVVSATKALRELHRVDDNRVRAGAGLSCTQLARECIRWELGPSEFFAGIPGTVGGALAMNAGAHGGETWQRVESVQSIDRSGVCHSRLPCDYSIGYRSVTGPEDEWFLEATFSFDPEVTPSMEAMKTLLLRRKTTQPLGLPSCGSVFRNPPGDHSARLIESAGLKGYQIGGAQVSEKHANFIINRDNATATDVEALIDHVRQTVLDKHDIDLVHEVRIVGEAAS